MYKAVEPIVKAILRNWGKNQMTRAKWYSPQLSREIVSRLYFKAKAEQVPMTVLANRIIEEALSANESPDTTSESENNIEKSEN
jgi:hypothetical protein